VTGNSAVKSAVKPRDKVERRVVDRMDTLATALYEFGKHDPDISSLHEVSRNLRIRRIESLPRTFLRLTQMRERIDSDILILRYDLLNIEYIL